MAALLEQVYIEFGERCNTVTVLLGKVKVCFGKAVKSCFPRHQARGHLGQLASGRWLFVCYTGGG